MQLDLWVLPGLQETCTTNLSGSQGLRYGLYSGFPYIFLGLLPAFSAFQLSQLSLLIHFSSFFLDHLLSLYYTGVEGQVACFSSAMLGETSLKKFSGLLSYSWKVRQRLFYASTEAPGILPLGLSMHGDFYS